MAPVDDHHHCTKVSAPSPAPPSAAVPNTRHGRSGARPVNAAPFAAASGGTVGAYSAPEMRTSTTRLFARRHLQHQLENLAMKWTPLALFALPAVYKATPTPPPRASASGSGSPRADLTRYETF